MIVPFAVGGLTDVPARVLAGMLQDRIGQTIIVENKPGGSGTLGGAYAVRAAPDGYTLFANSIADAQNLWFIPVPYNAIDDFAMIGMIVEGPPLVLIVDADAAVQVARRIARRREGQPEQNQLRHIRAGHLARDGAGAAQCARQDRDRRRALCGLRRSRAQRLAERRPGRVCVLRPGEAACRRRQSARARDRAARSGSRPGPKCRPCRSWAFRISTMAASSASRRRPRRRRRSSPILNKALNDVVQSPEFRSRMAALGMTVPAENTPERLADYHAPRDQAPGRVGGAHRHQDGDSEVIRGVSRPSHPPRLRRRAPASRSRDRLRAPMRRSRRWRRNCQSDCRAHVRCR